MVAMISSKMSHLDDLARTQCQSPEASDYLLLPMLMGLSRDLSSFKTADDSSVVQTSNHRGYSSSRLLVQVDRAGNGR